MTLEEQLEEQAKKGLLGLGLKEETASTYAPWASLLAQFVPGVGEGVGIDNTVDAINDERYGDAAIEGGLTLLGAVPVVGDVAAAAIKGMRKAPVKVVPKRIKKPRSEMTPEEHLQHDAYLAESLETRRAKNQAKLDAMTPEEYLEHKAQEAERMRRQRAGRSPEKLEADRARDAQAARERRSVETPEETAERNRKKAEAKRAKVAAMTPEEQAAYIQKGADDYARRRAAMSDEEIEAVRARGRKYSKDNPEVGRRLRAARRAAQEERTAPWSSKEEIDEIYRIAQEVSAETGVPHHVDHIIPMRGRGDSVSGLHHQDNLLVVPWSENLGKGNKYTPGSQSPMGGVDVARSLFEEVLKSRRR